ncbi:MAG: hypothetical protein JWM10_5218 [Myxococcaceae bacterium]|nr:hypothetical protein [Myxococcaceae bacterium]
MRPLLLALCAAFAVIFTGGAASAQQVQVRCYGVLASHLPIAHDQVTSPAKTGKQITAAALPSLPSRSQAPTLCSDPSQPGCHVDRPDSPRHPSSWDLHHEPVELTTHTLDIPPQAVDTFDPAAQFHGGPRAGQARTPWRPPSA